MPDRSGRNGRRLSRWRWPGGKRGRGAPGKTLIVAAVETMLGGKPVRLKLSRVKGFRRKEVEKLARRSLDPTSTAVSDGLSCSVLIDTFLLQSARRQLNVL